MEKDTHVKCLVAFLHKCSWVGAFALFIIFQPINILWNYFAFKSEIGLETNFQKHKESVADIQRQVKEWVGRGTENKDQKMATARPAWKSIAVTKSDKSKYFKIPINLNQILNLDEDNKTVTVEPGVMTGQISRYLFKRGWTIPLIPELDTLSIGGLICGTGIESSSHKLGLFHDTVLSYEIVLPNGEVTTCSRENDPDLFYSIPGSFATIGFLTAITIPLIPAKRYVRLDYRSVSSISEFRALLKNEPNHDYVEGLAFSKNEFVIMFGDLDDGFQNQGGTVKVNHINRWYKQPFYKQVENILTSKLQSSASFVEYIPLIDYYHRHTRGIFWELPKTMPLMNSKLFLFFLGWGFPIHVPIQRLAPIAVWKFYTKGHIIQDYIVPMEKAAEFFEAGHKLLKIYPVWMCPVRMMKTRSMFPSQGDGDYLDLGFYSYPEAEGFHHVKTLQALEQICIDCKGFQLLYAECFMSKNQFREMYNVSVYDKVRVEKGCETAFPDVYDKVGPKARNLDKLQSC